jgi:hypothetical protein
LAGRIEASDSVEPRTVEVSLGGGDFALERCLRLGIRFDNGHGSCSSSSQLPDDGPSVGRYITDDTEGLSPAMA